MCRLLGGWRGAKARPRAAVPADVRAIRDLLDRYHRAINFRDWDALGALFAEDAVWEARAPLRMRFVGRAAIVRGLLQWSVGGRALLVQGASEPRIDALGDGRARARSTLLQLGEASRESAGLRAVAVLSSDLVRQGGAWRFKRCRIELDDPGEAPRPR